MKLRTERIGEEKIDIEVNNNGKFSAEFNEETFTADSFDALVEQLRKVEKKLRSAKPVDCTILGVVPATPGNWRNDGPFEEGIGVVQAKLRGMHSNRRGVALLVTDDKAKQKFIVGTYSSQGTLARRLSAEEVERYLELRRLEESAEKAVQEFVDSVRVDGNDLLEQAREAQAAQA